MKFKTDAHLEGPVFSVGSLEILFCQWTGGAEKPRGMKHLSEDVVSMGYGDKALYMLDRKRIAFLLKYVLEPKQM